MPVSAQYDYVRCYAYTPGAGAHGTDNNFSLLWEDNFNELDTAIWRIEPDGGFGGNYCRFKDAGVTFEDGFLSLTIDSPVADVELIPVTFSVETTYEDLNPGDMIYLNGSFNAWCGTCEPMNKIGDRWSVTIDLPPGVYEYLFTKNGWEEIGGTPLGSTCDYVPCDEYNNYGIVLSSGTPYAVPNTPCWGSCEACAVSTGLSHTEPATSKQLLRITDLLGRETPFQAGQLLLYYYADGSVDKKIIWE
jgi:hypothetical protein